MCLWCVCVCVCVCVFVCSWALFDKHFYIKGTSIKDVLIIYRRLSRCMQLGGLVPVIRLGVPIRCKAGVATLFVWRAEKLPQKTWRAQICVQKSLAGKI